MTEPNVEFVTAWIAALNSDRFVQGRGRLRSFDDSRCCLGVACDVYEEMFHPGELTRWSLYSEREGDCWVYDDHAGNPPDEILSLRIEVLGHLCHAHCQCIEPECSTCVGAKYPCLPLELAQRLEDAGRQL
jgi:hypothetical protein